MSWIVAAPVDFATLNLISDCDWLPGQPIYLSVEQPPAWVSSFSLSQVYMPPVAIEPEFWFTNPEEPDQDRTGAFISCYLSFSSSVDIVPAAIDPLTGVGEANPVAPSFTDGSLQEPPTITDFLDKPSTVDPCADLAAAENQVDWTIGPIYCMMTTVYCESYISLDCIMPAPCESDDLNILPASFVDLSAIESTTPELSLSGESALQSPMIVGCEPYSYFIGEPFLFPEFTSFFESGEPLVYPYSSSTEPSAELVNNGEGLTGKGDNYSLEVEPLAAGPDASASIVSSDPIRFLEPYYRSHVVPMVFALLTSTDVTPEGCGEGVGEPLPSLTPAGEEVYIGGDSSGWVLMQPPEDSVSEPFWPSGFDAPGKLPASSDLSILGCAVTPDPLPLRGATVDFFSAYLAFLQSNPQWLDDHGATGIQMQVMTPSSYLPSLDFPTPGDARAFDAWYEQIQLPNGAICSLIDQEQPPLPLFCPPPSGTPTPGDHQVCCEISALVPTRSEQPAPPPTTVLAASQAPPESVSAQELVPSTSGHSTAALILSIPEEPGAAASPSAAASPHTAVSPLATPAPVAVTNPPSTVGESDLLLARRRREEPAEMTLLPIG